MANDVILPATGGVLKTREADGGHYQKFDLTSDVTHYEPSVAVSTSGYVEGDCLGGLITLANAARVNGGLIRVSSVSLQIVGNQFYVQAFFYKASVTAVNSSPFDPRTNFDDLVGVFQTVYNIPMSGSTAYYNSVKDVTSAGWFPVRALDATSLFVVLVTDANAQPSAAGALTMTVEVERF